MDKRGVKILISCLLCTVIVSILFMFAFRISRLTCELESIEPDRLRVAQLEHFDKKRNKPVRSHDKMILMKVSAYLEYNIMNKNGPNESTNDRVAPDSRWPSKQANGTAPLGAAAVSGQPPPPALGQQQQQSNSSGNQFASRRAEKRFLPLELDSIETRNLVVPEGGGGANSAGTSSPAPMSKHKYILSFNCTKLNMVFVYQANRVYVESMSMELKPKSNQKVSCELELPKTGAFAVESALDAASANKNKNDHLAHFFCNKPLSYSCRHYSHSGPSASSGLLLAELHINAIEFETATPTLISDSDHQSSRPKYERKHVKQEFKSKRNECNVPPNGS